MFVVQEAEELLVSLGRLEEMHISVESLKVKILPQFYHSSRASDQLAHNGMLTCHDFSVKM